MYSNVKLDKYLGYIINQFSLTKVVGFRASF